MGSAGRLRGPRQPLPCLLAPPNLHLPPPTQPAPLLTAIGAPLAVAPSASSAPASIVADAVATAADGRDGQLRRLLLGHLHACEVKVMVGVKVMVEGEVAGSVSAQ